MSEDLKPIPVAAMSDEQAALERDAARYRYLRRHMPEWHLDMGKPCTEALAAAERAAVERLPGWKLLDILQNSDSLKVRAEFDAWLVPLIRAAILRGDRDLPLCEAAVFEAVAEEALNER